MTIRLWTVRFLLLLIAGEAASAPVAAALAAGNFDATGVGLRTVPFTAGRIKAAVAEA
jgi:CO/xanthine dehydrogenase Mo-binding subunit